MGFLWLVVMSQAEADWWGKGKGHLSLQEILVGNQKVLVPRVSTAHKHHGAGLQHPAGHPGHPAALCNHSWAISWVIMLCLSWEVILGQGSVLIWQSQIAVKERSRAGEPRLSSRRWKVWRCREGSVCVWAVGSAGDLFVFMALFSLNSHPRCRNTGGAVHARVGAAVPLPGHLLPLSPVQLHWARVAGLGSNYRKVLLPFLVLTDIYSTRHRRCSSALSE